jgi:hypothetical protein
MKLCPTIHAEYTLLEKHTFKALKIILSQVKEDNEMIMMC